MIVGCFANKRIGSNLLSVVDQAGWTAWKQISNDRFIVQSSFFQTELRLSIYLSRFTIAFFISPTHVDMVKKSFPSWRLNCGLPVTTNFYTLKNKWYWLAFSNIADDEGVQSMPDMANLLRISWFQTRQVATIWPIFKMADRAVRTKPATRS